MSHAVTRAILTIASTLLLQACATNAIRLDRATTLGDAGAAATDQTRTLMTQVRATNREVIIDLVTADPRCGLPTPLIATGAAADGSELCRRSARQPNDFEIKRWTEREFKPSLAVIEGISTYLGAVDAVVTRKPVDLAAQAADAEAKLRGISNVLTGAAGLPAAPTLTADQLTAIKGTLGLLSEIIDESKRVEDLRKIELKLDPARFSENLDALEKVNEALIGALDGQIMHQRTLTALQLARLRDAKAEARRPLVARQLDLIDLQDALPELRQALSLSVTTFREAHAAYRQLLFDRNAPLSEAEKRKLAQVTQARIVAALRNLAAVAKAF